MGDEWGPGAPMDGMGLSAPTGPQIDSSEEPEDEPEEEKESTEANSDASEGPKNEEAAEGSVRSVFQTGEYGFLPVFGFNESNIAARKYAVNNGFEEDDTVINVREDEPLTIGGKELTWWEDDSIIPKHPMMLVNPLGFASVDPEVHNFRDVFRVEKGEHFVFSDSGGYQLMSMTGEDGKTEAKIVDTPEENNFKKYRVHPETLVEWQTANADAGATIDYPPYNISGDSSFPDAADWGQDWKEFFDMRLGKSHKMTRRMAERLAELRESGDEQAQDFLFTPVVHGKPHPDHPHHLIGEWHQSMKDAAGRAGIEPEGWVLKPEPASNFGQIALFLGYASEYMDDVDYIHVLMVGGTLQKALIQYYAMQSDHFLTSDASSYAAGGKRRQFDLPKTAGRRAVIISSRDDDAENAALNPTRLDRYPCRCPVCSTVENELGFEFVTEGSGSARSVSLNLHNLHQSLGLERTLDALLREEDTQIVETGGEPTGNEFWRFTKNIARDKSVEDLYRAMDYVRIAVEDGLDAANETYRIRWEKKDSVSIDRGSGSAGEVGW